MSQRERMNEDYLALANKIVSETDEENRSAVSRIMSDERTMKTYDVFVKDGLNQRTIGKIMRHGMKDLAEDGKVSQAAYTRALAEELTEYDEGTKIVRDMYKKGILSEKSYEVVREELAGKHKRVVQESGLAYLARAAMWVFMVTGLLFMAFSASSITGAVVGTREQISEIFIVGLYVFGIGVFLFNVSRRN